MRTKNGLTAPVDALKVRCEEINLRQMELSTKIASSNVDAVSWKTDRRMGAYPLFAPDKKNRYDVFEYISPDGLYRLKVLPHPELGRAKVWDADVFNYFLSRAYHAWQKTHQIPYKIETTAYQILKNLGKDCMSGKNIAWLRDAIARLQGTNFQSQIFSGIKSVKGFNLLNYDFEEAAVNGKPVIGKIVIRFNPELIECWLGDIKHILSLPNGVLDESVREQKSGLRKKLLLLIGTRLGTQESIRLSLDNFKGLCGYTGENRRFKSAIKGILPTLPWRVRYVKSTQSGGENVVITADASLAANFSYAGESGVGGRF